MREYVGVSELTVRAARAHPHRRICARTRHVRADSHSSVLKALRLRPGTEVITLVTARLIVCSTGSPAKGVMNSRLNGPSL
jgi:hypothetical protein